MAAAAWRRPALARSALLVLLLAAAAAAQDAGVVPAGDPAASSPEPEAVPAETPVVVPAVTDVPVTTAPLVPAATDVPVTTAPLITTETDVPVTTAPLVPAETSAAPSPTPSLVPADAAGPSTSGSASGSATGSADAANAAVVPAEGSESTTAAADSGMSRAKLAVIAALGALGACVLLGLVGWSFARARRRRRQVKAGGGARSPSGARPGRPALVPWPEGAVATAIAVMGDPAEDKRPSRLSLGLRRSLADARALGSASSPASLRGGGSTASFSSLIEFLPSSRASGRPASGSASGSASRASAAAPGVPPSPTLAVLELHRFSGTSSTASASSPTAANPRARSVILRDLTQPPAARASSHGRGSSQSRGSNISSISSGLSPPGDELADADESARLDWFHSIGSPTDDEQFARLTLGDRQSYEL